MKRIAIALLGVALAAGLAAPARAEMADGYQGGFYIGAGLTLTDFESDMLDLDAEEGGGFQFDLGWRANPHIALDWCFSSVLMQDMYGWDVDYFNMSLGPKFSFLPIDQTGFTPWVMVGLAWHSLEWVDFADSMEGSGVTVAVGVDIMISPYNVIQVSFRNHDWEGDYKEPSTHTIYTGIENSVGEFTVNWLFYM